MPEQLTSERLTQAVKDFWKAFSNNSQRLLTDFYAPDATLFGVEGARAELARLAQTRREREYSGGQAKITIELGSIDVRLLGDTAGIAMYGFCFRATNVNSVLGKVVERTIAHGRATQIFQLDHAGRPMILHEHLSSADIRKQ